MSGIEDVARSWLLDPPWQRVFKHSLDVAQDYAAAIMVAVGAVALSVRLLSTLGSGDLGQAFIKSFVLLYFIFFCCKKR